MEGGTSSPRVEPNALKDENQHICAFFNGMDEHYRVLQSFIKDGFDRGDKAFHLVDPKRREDHLTRLADTGIDVEETTASGQLEVHPWEDGPLHGERFDQDTWLAGFEEVLQSGRIRVRQDEVPGADGMGAGRPAGHRRHDRVRDAGQLRRAQVRAAGDLRLDLSKFDTSTVIYTCGRIRS